MRLNGPQYSLHRAAPFLPEGKLPTNGRKCAVRDEIVVEEFRPHESRIRHRETHRAQRRPDETPENGRASLSLHLMDLLLLDAVGKD